MLNSRRWFSYAIGDGSAVKIGRTSRLRDRLDQLQTGNPRALALLAVREHVEYQKSKSFEIRFHEVMKKQHIRGEWFDLIALDSFFNPPFQRNIGKIVDAGEALRSSRRRLWL